MIKILFIPLDERPCNRMFPEFIVASGEEVSLITPPKEILGDKKNPASIEKLWDFIFENIKECTYGVLSMDMLLYGGLIPSRLHYLSMDVAERYLNNIRKIKLINPNIKIYAFNCIMRAPQYNSSEEEPDYYEEYGYRLFRRSYLLDKEVRFGITEEEEDEKKSIKIPENILLDYESRRFFNEEINIKVAKLIEEDVIDFLVIPQDDSSEFGYTAISQKRIIDFIKDKKLEFKTSVYPGADEVGSSLLARCLNDYLNRRIKIFPFYASTLGPEIIPLYEDRPMNESLKYHTRVCLCELVESPEKADLILAINSPGKKMQEASVQIEGSDLTYTSHRNLLDFVYKIEAYLKADKKVILCDSAYANGGDLQLINYLDRMGILLKLTAYAGWNTNCNTLGTVIASGIYALESENNSKIKHLVYRIIEDAFYQSIVRQRVAREYLPKMNLSYYDFKTKQEEVENTIRDLLIEEYNKLISSKEVDFKLNKVETPWKRMFEIGMDIS